MKKVIIQQNTKHKLAFTLVEVIVVITILTILWTIAFMSLQWYSEDARDSTRISDLSSIKTLLELYELDAGKYPLTTSWVNITYTWSVVWNQWTFWETVYANVNRLDKIPIDPLTDKEYTYSTLLSRNEYELWWIMEGDEISMNSEKWIINNVATSPLTRGELRGVSAWEVEAIAYTTWNYNWQMTKSLSWNTCTIFSIPTIITNDTSVTDLEQILTEQKLVYSWYRNLPSSFKTSKFKYDWWFDFITPKLIAYSDTWSCAPLTSTTSNTARLTLLQWLQQAYSGTIIQDKWEIKKIVSLNIDLNNPSPELINYSNNYINNTLWWNLPITLLNSTNNNITTYNNCTATTQSWYTIPQINHGINNQLVNKIISNGSQDLEVSCNDGILSYGIETTNCDNDFIVSNDTCVLDNCTGTMPDNSELNWTQWTATWSYSTTPWVCKYTNQAWYHTEDWGITFVSDTRFCVIANGTWEQNWNGSNWWTCSVVTCDSNYVQNWNTCEAWTQNVSCGWSIPTNPTASTSSTYTQTWNWSGWTPSISWWVSQASCDFNCNSGYSWNGSSCASNSYPWCNASDIPFWGYTIAACNVWTNISWTGSSSYGYYFQWWNNGWTPSWTITPSNLRVDSSSYWPWNYYNNTTFIGWSIPSPWDWSTVKNDNLWWNTDNNNNARQWPCASGYHVPSYSEWSSVITSWWWWWNGTNMMNTLKLPMAWGRNWTNGTMYNQWTYGIYWTSTPTSNNAYYVNFRSDNSNPNFGTQRSYGFTVRCFKN